MRSPVVVKFALISSQQFLDNPRAGHFRIGQAFGATTVHVGQAAVIQPELVQQCGVEIRNAHAVFNSSVSKFIGGSIGEAGGEASTCEKHAEGIAIVVSSIGILRDRQAAKLAGPHHDDIVKHPTLL